MVFDSLRRDARDAARGLAARPLHAFVTALTLALVVGFGGALLAVVDAALIRPLPFEDASRLARIHAQPPGTTEVSQRLPLHPLEFVRFRAQSRHADAVEGLWALERALGGDEPESLPAARVSAGLFALLGAGPVLGRTFGEDEDRNDARVVVLSHGLWQRRFGGDPGVLGRTLSIDREPYEVVGVMGPGFEPAYVQSQFWTPLAIHEGNLPNPRSAFVQNVARLRPGSSVGQLSAEVAARMAVLAKETPSTHVGWSGGAASLRDAQFGAQRPALLLLTAAVGVLALIACVNLAHLTLAQAMRRRLERAVRAALGAGTRDLARLQALECVMLAAVGTATGLALAHAALPALLGLDPQAARLLPGVGIDFRVAAGAALLGTFVALFAGLLPLARERGQDPAGPLAAGRGGVGPPAEGRLRTVLVAVETALATVLVSAGALLLSGFEGLAQQRPGFEPNGVLTAQLRLAASDFPTEASRAAQLKRVLDRLAATPGVESAATTLNQFRPGFYVGTQVEIEGKPTPDGRPHLVQFRRVSPGYFRTMRIPLLEGRDFGKADTAEAPAVVVVSRSFARRFWPGESALGKRLLRSNGFREVVGVVGDVSDVGYGRPQEATLYVAYAQNNAATVAAGLVVRARDGDAASLAPTVKAAVQALDPAQPLGNVVTLESFLEDSLGPQRFRSTLLLAFAGLGLALAVLGVYGVTARSVQERTREVGVRLALGAEPNAVWRLVVAQALRAVALGAVAGALVAAVAANALVQSLPGMEHAQAASVVPAILALAATAFAAAAIPALRAARVDPLAALRED